MAHLTPAANCLPSWQNQGKLALPHPAVGTEQGPAWPHRPQSRAAVTAQHTAPAEINVPLLLRLLFLVRTLNSAESCCTGTVQAADGAGSG